ncbi:MAG: DUF192 domain-containing protein [Saprospiraceae bacterium]|nr:DUF192 domain-containing protein [Saprospiraceae bacterium]
MNSRLYLLCLLFALAACQSDPKPLPPPPPPPTTQVAPPPPTTGQASVPEPPFVQEGVLEFRSADEEQSLLVLYIEIAHEDQERMQGLMWRKKMEERQGMLFVFDWQSPQSFWMRNTYIPLDIIYIDEQFKVVSIRKNTPVLNDSPQPSGVPARYVVEVNAGVSDKYGIQPGSRVAWTDMVKGQAMGPFEVKDL